MSRVSKKGLSAQLSGVPRGAAVLSSPEPIPRSHLSDMAVHKGSTALKSGAFRPLPAPQQSWEPTGWGARSHGCPGQSVCSSLRDKEGQHSDGTVLAAAQTLPGELGSQEA